MSRVSLSPSTSSNESDISAVPTAQLIEVRARNADGTTVGGPHTVAQVYRFTPPVEGDDGHLHGYGAALSTNGVVDVFACRPDGQLRSAAVDGFVGGFWVELFNCWATDGPTTVEALLARHGYEVVR